MQTTRKIQGRIITNEDIATIRFLLKDNPTWHRTRLSRELCEQWNWHTIGGRQKDMACRSMLLKLEREGLISLPSRRQEPVNAQRNRGISYVTHDKTPVECSLKEIEPVQIKPVKKKDLALFKCLLFHYHYLGYADVGRNMKYLFYDKDCSPLGCLLFGSAAWKTEDRDGFIGWDAPTRENNLRFITNNMRFLILPWVRVKCLASHILGRVTRRIQDDWQQKYGFRVHLLETFVERPRFKGTCYKAANWIKAGQTKGRTRNDRDQTIRVAKKDIYLYPLSENFREIMQDGNNP